MRDRLLVLLLFGVGVVKIYEEYDEEEQEDGGSPDLIKHKHSRRDISDLALDNLASVTSPSPIPLDEQFIEALHMEQTASLFTKCHNVSEECSCRRLLCFSPGNCNGPAEQVLSNDTSRLHLRSVTAGERLYWIKRCRQATLAGQSLCECRRGLYREADLKLLQSSDSETDYLAPVLH